jgi:hypothetical protein
MDYTRRGIDHHHLRVACMCRHFAGTLGPQKGARGQAGWKGLNSHFPFAYFVKKPFQKELIRQARILQQAGWMLTSSQRRSVGKNSEHCLFDALHPSIDGLPG